MTPEEIAEYDRSRGLSGKAVRAMCYALHANLFFGQVGRALACFWCPRPDSNRHGLSANGF
jgi:hypothetical protein